MATYPGPIRGEPLAIELHNTLYRGPGGPTDGLTDAAGLRAWLESLADRLPLRPRAVDPERLDDFVALRAATRDALHAVHEGRPVPAAARAALNERSAASPESLALTPHGSELRHHGATPADVVLGVIAASAIAIVSGPHAGDLRACGAPGCILMFVRDHPRREWCSAACGNRARQARHYARSRARG
jgi:predicted RNA-binding Zn ribbon-like protein